MKGWLLMLVYVSVFSACGPGASEYAKQAEDAFKSGDYKGSAEFITKAIEKDGDNANYFSNRGRCYIRLNENDKASADFEQAIKCDPFNWNRYDMAGLHYRRIGDYTKAIAKFTDGLAIDTIATKSKIFLLFNRGHVRVKMKDFEGGLKDDMEGYKLDTTNSAAMAGLALTYDEWGRYDEAEKWFKKAIAANIKGLSTYNLLGFLYIKTKRYTDAIAVYKKGLELYNRGKLDYDKESEGFIYNNLGFAELQTGNLDDAIANIDEGIRLLPDNSYAYKNRALYYIKTNKTGNACADLKKAKELGYAKLHGAEVDELLAKYCK